MTLYKVRRTVVAIVASCLSVFAALADVPTGWSIAGSSPRDYEFSQDSSTASNGRYSALIAAKPGIVPNGFGTLMQTIDAENYRGGRWRLSGYLKTSDATRAQMWMRVDGPDRRVVSFDNMDSRPVTGTTGWTRYEIVLDVPSDSVDIAFGFLLTQHGKVWADNFKLEKVGAAVPVTSAGALTVIPKEPVNTDFENAADSSFIAESVDVSDIYRANGPLGPHYLNKYNLCGMHITARARQPGGAALEWDLKLSVFMNSTTRLASIAAGSFTLPTHTNPRVPRRPITGLVVRLDGMTEPASARISGVPNSSNGVTGEFPEPYAEKLFDAFDAGAPFTMELTYDSGERETVRARTLGGIGETEKISFYHGSDAPTRKCLGSLVPASKSGLQGRLVERAHPS